MTVPMSEMPHGSRGTVLDLRNAGSLRARLLDLGLVPGTSIERMMNSPGGDPICYNVRGAMIALRACDATNISVEI